LIGTEVGKIYLLNMKKNQQPVVTSAQHGSKGAAATNMPIPAINSTKEENSLSEKSIRIIDSNGLLTCLEYPSSKETFYRHVSSIKRICRNPFLPQYFVSIGDPIVRLWNEKIHGPIFYLHQSTKKGNVGAVEMISAASWSSTRPSVLYLGKTNGRIEVWDFLFSKTHPILDILIPSPMNITKDKKTISITCIECFKGSTDEKGKQLLVGDSVGNVHILEVSKGLASPIPNPSTHISNDNTNPSYEKAEMQAWLERESAREEIMEKKYIAQAKLFARTIQLKNGQ
jgi:WD40 repeat protein